MTRADLNMKTLLLATSTVVRGTGGLATIQQSLCRAYSPRCSLDRGWAAYTRLLHDPSTNGTSVQAFYNRHCVPIPVALRLRIRYDLP